MRCPGWEPRSTPVNIRWSPAEIAYSLVESDTRVLFVDDAFAPMLPALRDPGLSTVIHCGDGDLPAGALSYETLIAGYQAPRSVDFVDGLPMSGAGKILKRDLREQYWDGSGNQVS
jgi:acyl-CoA synthetase (AMP-forming)/AMP-acid ligase II